MIALSKAATILNRLSQGTPLRSTLYEQMVRRSSPIPITKFWQESIVSKEIHEIVPSDGVTSLLNVKFE
jgi:hypothetical protein